MDFQNKTGMGRVILEGKDDDGVGARVTALAPHSAPGPASWKVEEDDETASVSSFSSTRSHIGSKRKRTGQAVDGVDRAMNPVVMANLNHCRAAQDMMSQVLAEWGVGLAVAAEPYRVPDHPHWVGDADGLVATVWGGGDGSPPFSILERGRGFVAVDWGGVAVVGCYISPRSGHAAFELYLAEVAACVQRCAARPVLVLGDFNAKSVAWGSPRTTVRGGILGDWAAGLDLRLLNRGSEHTCVLRYGGSIVDVGFATPNAVRMVSGWQVAPEAETLSDHRYIRMEVSAAGAASRHRPPDGTPPRRWALRRLDKDALMAAALAATWPQVAAELPSMEEEAARLG
ncbi:uncharacterized protein LOC122404159, partial [Colletes gigas]|uniref:uncharacterized protein LOC122404159 n=1 Tax=Colletes gigas TaxID=935657 RepID=UPI001C9AC5B9